jgi:hypothetical protein
MNLDGTGLIPLGSGFTTPNNVAANSSEVFFTTWVANGAVMRVPIGGGTPPTFFAKNQNQANDIAIDGENVYWTVYGSGTVLRQSLAGGPPLTLASGQTQPQEIALDANNIYWTSSVDGTVMQTTK